MASTKAVGGPEIVSTGPTRIQLVVRIEDRAPSAVFRDWTDPDRLRLWWPPEARIEAREGGTYEFSWPKMNWRLRGSFEWVVPNSRLTFSWCWDHEPDITKRVDVELRPTRTGTEVTVEHGTYGDSPRDIELRKEHLDGWVHFLGRLAELRG
jgi:uncharacterized protein YndB with AHSA1/START domain